MKVCTDALHIFNRNPDYGESCKCGKMPYSIPEIDQRNIPRTFMNNLVSLARFREKQKVNREVQDYQELLGRMDKLELLEEMVRFQEWRSKSGELTAEMIVKGLILFPLLTKMAETKELRLLTTSYARHLEYELANRKPPLPPGA